MMCRRIILVVAAVVMLCACGKDDDQKTVVLSQHKLTLKAGETIKLEVSGVPGAEWKTDEFFIADVSGGNVSARHVGETTIRATYKGSSDECVVTVEPKYNILLQPVLKFGASPEEIKALETRPYKERVVLTTLFSDVYAYAEDNEIVYDFYISNNTMKFASQEVTSRLSLTDVYAAIAERLEVLDGAPADKQIFYHPVQKYYMVLSVPHSGYIYKWHFTYSSIRWWES